ncbi:glucosyltransferase domain-containing protein [Cronobacter sakazakii]|uniref:glucosyltransferase domain-containing protein n=1 Tax=Cronobacter sakazakii TaxID=28141 RepID=UPI0028941455|nr:glucosyltransferase domain-containing protein [Cronobacter sakazakii]MDT3522648.1 glucosyltransferase domain-containing protein [Cronobacter sakazakii]
MNSMRFDMNKLKPSFIISILYILPILMAGSIYIDDNTRVFRDFGWTVDGRYLSNLVYNVLSLGNGPMDFFPLTQIASGLILVISSAVIARAVNFSSVTAITVAILSSPFLVQNLSYRLDSLTMAMSFLVILIPFLFAERLICFFVVGIVAVVSSSFLYQVSVMAFPCMCMIYGAARSRTWPELLYLILKSATVFVVGFLAYMVSAKLLGINSRSELFLSGSDPLGVLLKNASYVRDLVFNAFKSPLIVVLAAYIILWALCLYSSFKKGWRDLAMDLSFPILIAAISLSINVVLLNPWISSRTLLVFPLVFVYLVTRCDFRVARNVLLIIASIFSFGFCAVYANALKAQDDFNRIIMEDIKSLMIENQIPIFVISGGMPFSEETKRAAGIYPLLSNVMPRYFKEGSGWGQVYAKRVYGIHDASVKEQSEAVKEVCGGGWKPYGSLFYKPTQKVLLVRFYPPVC